ncbi:MAG: JAB domain-containing protein [Bacteroidota bacterium]
MEQKKVRTRSEMYEVEIIYKRPALETMPQISSSKDAYELITRLLNPNTLDYREVFLALFLTNSNNVLGYSELGKGTSTGVAIDAKDIILHAIKTHSKAIIICHNHPSGSLKPSSADKDMTAQLSIISNMFSINLLDNLIITSESYFSFADEGLLLKPNNTLLF